MPFGINSAPEVWQRTMNQLVEWLKGTEVIHDDILIVGCGDTGDEAEADHDRNLKAFLERARERNIRLNADKLKLKLTQVPYIGHLLTREGLRVHPKKVEAIEKMPAPKDAKALQYVYGRDKVHVQSDHKPLEVIFKRPLVTAPKRLQRILLRLQRYSLEVTYVRGSEMYIADTLSRAYIPGNPSVHAVTFAEIDMTEGLSVSPRRLQELRDATASDCVLQKLI